MQLLAKPTLQDTKACNNFFCIHLYNFDFYNSIEFIYSILPSLDPTNPCCLLASPLSIDITQCTHVLYLSYLLVLQYMYNYYCIDIGCLLYTELYKYSCYTSLPLYKYLDSLPLYIDIIMFWLCN